jgi:ATP-dependent Clp protease, protease subunit
MTPTRHLDGDILPGMAKDIAAWLEKHPGEATIYINSPGGSATEGAAIMASVEAHGGVTAIALGVIASAATLPFVAARRALIHPAAMLMVHLPSALADGTADRMRDAADALDKIGETYARAYARHTGHPVAMVLDWMRAETWLTADEAVELRFADALHETTEDPPMVARADYTRFKAAPEALRRIAAQHGWTAAPSEPLQGASPHA